MKERSAAFTDPDVGSLRERDAEREGTVLPASRPRLVQTCFSRASVARCVPTALVVGTLLSLVNQGSVIFGGRATLGTWIRVVLNYVIPFVVSSWGFFGSQLALWKREQGRRSTAS